MIHKILPLLGLITLLSCSYNKESDEKTEAGDKTQTESGSKKPDSLAIDSLNQQTTTQANDETINEAAAFTAPNGEKYYVQYLDPSPEELAAETDALDCDNDNFDGTDRRAAKISLANARFDSYETLTEFLSSLNNVDDEYMMAHSQISRSENNNRVREEKRNVTIEKAYLFAIKREGDNDFHLIIGNNRGTFFNIECSGLPSRNSSSYQALARMRNSLKDRFGALCNSRYTVFNRGIPVSVSGSLFYDIDHKPGRVGPEGYRPNTAWEIHPITSLEFL